ncbi:MAG: DUF4403 family protein [Bacteroidota bacterium]
MNLLIQLPLPVLRTFVNQAFEDMVAVTAEESDMIGVAGLEIRPLGEINLWGDGKDIMYSTVSLEVTAKIRTEGLPIPPLIRSLSPWEKIRCSLRVSLETHLYLHADWHLQATSQPSYEWIQKPSLGVGPVQVPVAAMVNPFLKPQMEQVANKVDALIQQQVPILQALERSWEKLHQYQLVDPANQVWLLTPLTVPVIGLTRLFVHSSSVDIGVHLPFHAHASMGQAPSSPPLPTLPTWESWGPFAPLSTVPLTASLPWSWLIQMLQKQPFVIDEGNNRLTVHVREIRSVDSKVQAQISFDGRLAIGRIAPKVRGEVHLQGDLAVHNNGLAVELTSLNFQVKKGGPLVRSVAVLFRRLIRQQIVQLSNTLLQGLARDIFQLVQKEVRKVELEQGFQLESELESYQLSNIQIQPEGVELELQAKGSSRLFIKEIPK